MSRCYTCEYHDECEYADGINFCDDCIYGNNCDLRYVSCEAGHDIECNNGFEDKSDYCSEDDEDGVGE